MTGEQCPGYGTRPARVTEWKRIGTFTLAMRGQCRRCGRDCALTSGGWVWAHKEPPPLEGGSDDQRPA